MQEIPVALCGLGTVGSAVVNLLQQHAYLGGERCGYWPRLVQIGARHDNPLCQPAADIEIERDIFKVATDPRSQIVVELIGGVEVAFELTMLAFKHKKHVVTANKALIAERGNELFTAAHKHGVGYFYEAAVAGGIPIIKVLREGLVANKVTRVAGIINGTSNYILTQMRSGGETFAAALKQAQKLGYAEADPTFDLDGSDAAHKLAIIAALAFGVPMPYQRVYKEGIDIIKPDDINWATELGFVVRHLAIAELKTTGGAAADEDDTAEALGELDAYETEIGEGIRHQLSLRVHPTLIHKGEALAGVDGVLNGVMVDSVPLGRTFYSGAGAGGGATASAVIADLQDAIHAMQTTDAAAFASLEVPLRDAKAPVTIPNPEFLTLAETYSEFFLRLMVDDRPGVLAQITEILGNLKISIEGITQKEEQAQAQHKVPVIIITHHAKESDVNTAIIHIERIPQVKGKVVKLRIL